MIRKLAATLFLIVTFGNLDVQAQFRPGIGLSWSSDTEGFGVVGNVDIPIFDDLAVVTDYYYFPDNKKVTAFLGSRSEVTKSLWEVNVNARIYVGQTNVEPYAIVGFNYSKQDAILEIYDVFDILQTRSTNENSKFGMNVGFGVSFNMGRVVPFIDGKYVAFGTNAASLGVGLRFNLG